MGEQEFQVGDLVTFDGDDGREWVGYVRMPPGHVAAPIVAVPVITHDGSVPEPEWTPQSKEWIVPLWKLRLLRGVNHG